MTAAVRATERRLRTFLSPEFAKILAPIHQQIAETMAQGMIECLGCHRSQPLTVDLVTEYLQHGWPKCHGAPMAYFGPTPGGKR